QDYVKRARILPAIQGLSARATQMEQCYQDNHTYDPTPACRACNTATDDHFEFSCEKTATTFTLTATGQDMMSGFVYTVNQAGARTSTITGHSGWTGNGSCWVTSKGGAC
ncbi:MAG: general secretion pathway protein GspH, partial [Candidatus Accumulibacter sp.]|nr:general secretion pathway protein GspH [Accumulibacter sp.]